jgi:hypothetical protein
MCVSKTIFERSKEKSKQNEYRDIEEIKKYPK